MEGMRASGVCHSVGRFIGPLAHDSKATKQERWKMQSSVELELGFLRDLVFLLKEEAAAAKAASATGDEYARGRHFAYFEVLDLVLSQALAFEIDLKKIGLEGFDPYQDILGVEIRPSAKPASEK
jgi:hypothetical protein